MRYFEDFKVGEVIESGTRTINKDEIIAFAREFDPQPFHTDEAAARETMYGGLIASGWHSGSLMMRLFYDSLFRDSASHGLARHRRAALAQARPPRRHAAPAHHGAGGDRVAVQAGSRPGPHTSASCSIRTARW